MDETIKILREQAILCAHLPDLFDELIKILQNNSPDVQEPIKKIEDTLRNLNKNEQKAEDFLKRVNAASFAEYLSAQEKNIQRDVAEKLLKKTSDAQFKIKNQTDQLKLLLKKGKDYVAFNLNILARTSASDTYGAAAQTGSQRTRRIFEANI
ncbi:MAG: flagellar export chaperone FlgN [Selenomonadaceae bacterium]|nr:flagellar export chaperone FlgN [Selenomonadaceae bacterium]MBR0261476.1 flagellar export chaperone FlgN [Selenomonadaceae bacterium]